MSIFLHSLVACSTIAIRRWTKTRFPPYCPDPFSRTTKKNSITSTIKSAYVTMMGYLRFLNLLEKSPFSIASAKTERSKTINNFGGSAWAALFFSVSNPFRLSINVAINCSPFLTIFPWARWQSRCSAMSCHRQNECAHGVPFRGSEKKILKVDELEGDRAKRKSTR